MQEGLRHKQLASQPEQSTTSVSAEARAEFDHSINYPAPAELGILTHPARTDTPSQAVENKVSEVRDIGSWMTAWETLRFIQRSCGKAALGDAAAAAISAGTTVASIDIVSRIVDTIKENGGDLWNSCKWLAAALVVTGVVNGLSIFARSYNRSILERNLMRSIEKHFGEGASSLSMEAIESSAVSDKITAARENLYRINQVVSPTINVAISLVAASVTAIGIGTKASWGVAALITGTIAFSTAISLFVEKGVAKRSAAAEEVVADDRRKFWHTRWLLIDTTSLKEIKLLNKASEIGSLVSKYLEKMHHHYQSIDKLRLIRAGGADLAGQAIVGGVTGWLIWQTTKGALTLGQLTGCLSAIQYIRMCAGSVTQGFSLVVENLGSLQRIFAIAPVDGRTTQPGASTRNKSLGVLTASPKIEFKNVTHTYEGHTKPSLKNINLTFSPGDRVALVGQNGAGKSTLLSLLCGNMKPTSGQILVNDIDLQDIPTVEWLENLAVQLQEPVRISSMTIRQSIEIGNGNRDKVSAEKAAEVSGASKFLTNKEKLPLSYESVSGKDFKDGIKLSGGQEQLVAASRTIARSGWVTVFDEPASNLDSFAEERLFNNVLNEHQDRTIILISHHFGTLLRANKIIVLNNGEIDKVGDHATLMEESEIYRAMFLTQSLPYLKALRGIVGSSIDALIKNAEKISKSIDATD